MSRHHMTPDGPIPFSQEEEAEWDALEAQLEANKIEELRNKNKNERNQKMTECDWTQLGDVPLTEACKAAFVNYRQALRDIDLLDPVWPDAPQEEWVN